MCSVVLKIFLNFGYTLVKIYQSGTNDDGIIDVYQNNAVKARIHGNGTSILGGGG